eukprot:CAMPEP_0194229798 /NCGR_PEP_ID=MMETSP0156-20130528/44077_1 /TAXON_ID=33649 /ORGANISM="Thalassionema nitzschioides, Strain L26-B" /LENGTH=304 /DNA_ID=CAMNT_0038962357 /DNA_START=14 /DNA_END=928 /DNA_ORIENTATION=+
MKELSVLLYLISLQCIFGHRTSTTIWGVLRGGMSSNVTSSTATNYTFSLFQEGDGHEEDVDSLPGRFLRMHKGNRKKAIAALNETSEWRKEKEVDTILGRPHATFDLCKTFQPHFFMGRDPEDHIVFVQRPGFTKLYIIPYMTAEDLLMHYCYLMEYCWNIMEDRPDQTMTAILDLAAVKMSSTKEMISFATTYVKMMSHHYPQRSFKTLIINAPTWFSVIYKIFQPLLRESTKKKIRILTKKDNQHEILVETIGGDVPRELSAGEEFTGWKDFPMEKKLREFCLARLRENGGEEQMVSVPPKP